MIHIKNTQRAIAIDRAQIEKDVTKILQLLKYPDFDIGIWFTTEKTIRTYNKTYRNKDKATDILSFPVYPDLKAGERIHACCDDDANLGDLILCPIYIFNDAPNWNHTFEERIRVLLVHGICHLLGYDHIKDEDYVIMNRKEKAILKKLNQ